MACKQLFEWKNISQQQDISTKYEHQQSISFKNSPILSTCCELRRRRTMMSELLWPCKSLLQEADLSLSPSPSLPLSLSLSLSHVWANLPPRLLCGPSTRPCRNKGVSVSPSGVSFSPSGVSFGQGILPRDTVSSTRRCCILRGPRASTAGGGGTAAAGSGAGHLCSHQCRHRLQRRGRRGPPAPTCGYAPTCGCGGFDRTCDDQHSNRTCGRHHLCRRR